MFWRRGIARLAAAVGLLSVALPAVVPDAEAMVPMAVPASGLVGYWSFDDSVNFNVPDSGGSTLTKGNSASWSASGKFGGALSLSGASQSLYDTSSPAWLPVGNSSYTQSVWFKPAAVSGAGGLVGWGNYGSGRRTIALRMYENSGGFRHYWWGADLDCTGAQCPLSAGTWYHVASTWDGTTRKLYLNGVLKRSDTPGANNATAANFHIGKTCCSEYFTGLIDEVAIYNRAVTASEIAELSSSTDITAPTASVTTATLNPSQSATVQSTETGTAYLVKSTVSVTNEASITGAAANLWNSVTVTSANTNTPLALTGLVSGTYKAYAVDAAGNLSAASSNSVTVDADVPTVAVSRSGSGTVGGGQSVDITFTLSESTTEFTADDVTVSGGTLSGFTGSGASYTATWTPPATGSGTASISVTANKFTDAAGNQNTASAVLSIVWNADRPSVEITRTGSGTVGAGQTASLTFTLSEASTNFVSENVTVSSGTLSGLTGTGTTYTAVWTPPASGSGTASISVTANKFTDAAGNLNTASTALSIAWNTNPATTTTAAPALEIIVQVPTTTTVAPPGTSLSGGSSVPDVVVPPVGVTTSTSAVRSVPRAGAATTSTSSTVAVVVTTTTDAVPRVPQVVTGAAAVETDGKKVPATVTREDNQIVVQAGPVTAKVAGVNEAG
ncbi:MAG: Ig-like domain-containing protein, partial [Acidimicrobiales bacterium]